MTERGLKDDWYMNERWLKMFKRQKISLRLVNNDLDKRLVTIDPKMTRT